jgi:uncharacterized membrane protein (UPF0127 family)
VTPRVAQRVRHASRALAILLLAPLGCGNGTDASQGRAPLSVASILVGHQRVTVEVAATPSARRRGLMHRESLPDDRGMLFVFPEERLLTFWMKDTHIPLSIAFAREDGTIVHIAELEPRSERPVSSRSAARYALEMNRGWFARHGVLEGDAMRRIPRAEAE